MDVHVLDLESDILTGLVTQVTFNLQKTQDGKTIGHRGLQKTLSGDASSADFIPYDDLTEDIVSAWVLATYTQEELDALEDLIDSAFVSRQKNSDKTNGIPWGE